MKPDFFVALGDNFYNNGVTSDVDPLWKLYYRDLYTAPATQVPWYAVLGNHDYYGTHTPEAQINYYLNKRDKRWNLPSHQYTKTWSIPGTHGMTLQIVFIDTVQLAPMEKCSDTGMSCDPAVQAQQVQPYLDWFEKTLKASKATYLIVAGHYHVYTVTDGDGPTAELVQRIVPLMQKYKVTAYINGHEHNHEVS